MFKRKSDFLGLAIVVEEPQLIAQPFDRGSAVYNDPCHGIIDSTGFLEVAGFIEDEFNIEVADRELIPDNFDSVDKLSAYIDRKVQSSA